MGRTVPPAVLCLTLLALLVSSGTALAADPAPSFRLIDTDGTSLTSAGLRGQVVLLEFFSTQCAPCEVVREKLLELHPTYGEDVVFLSVGVWPVDTRDVLRTFRERHGIPWHLAPDDSGMVSKYVVATIPDIRVIDAAGFLVWEWYATFGWSPEGLKASLAAALDQALGGALSPLDFAELSVPVLLVVAALLSFFSPCSFPVLPAYMTYYLRLEADGGRGTVRAAVGRGFVASLGLLAVYGSVTAVVFVLLALTQAAFSPPIALFSVMVGGALVLLGALALFPARLTASVQPLRALVDRLARAVGARFVGTRAKLFAFGIGYGAAGFACVAPPFFGAVLNAAAFGNTDQVVLGLALYVSIVVGLMIAITVVLQVAGDRALRRIRSWSRLIQYVSAVALLLAGAYLLIVFGLAYLG